MAGRRIAVVPEGWREVPLGGVAEVSRGISWAREQEQPSPRSDAVPVVRIGNVQPDGFRMDDTLYIRGVPDTEKARRSIKPTSLVMVGSNGNRDRVGNVFLANEQVSGHLLASFLIGINPGQSVSEHFLAATLRSRPIQSLITESTAGSTGLKNLSLKWLRALPLHLPPLPEQRAIAAVLDSIDEAIERTDEVIAATERLRDALLHELLTRGLPGHHTAWRDVPGLGAIPASWEVVRLGDVAEVQTGRAVNRNTSQNGGMEVPYLSVANVKDGYVDLDVVKRMRVSQEEIERYAVRADDVLFTEGGDADKLGRGTVWRGELDPCLHQNHVFVVRPHRDTLLPNFLSAFATSQTGRRYFLGAAKQTTNLASINSTQLKGMRIPLPTLREQQAIVGTLDSVDAAIEGARAERAALQSSKVSTADALLTGRVRVGG